MLTRENIRSLLGMLNDELAQAGEIGEVGIVGGAAMCIVYNARESTKDIDGVFEPTAVIRKLVKKIAERERLPPDWLNDAVKGYLEGEFQRQAVLSLSHLRVWTPEPRYMLAMKCLSARWDSHDREDVIHLLKLLKLKTPKKIFAIIEGYYPKAKIPAKTQFFIEEIVEKL